MVGFARNFSALIFAAGLAALTARVHAADLSLPITGNLIGSVLDASGAPQMGAQVELFDRFGKLIAKAASSPSGSFSFANLPADLYAVKVSWADCLPVRRSTIAVRPGLDSILQIHLATLLSSVELSYTLPRSGMSHDWKWVLRSSPATRPITQFLPEEASTVSRIFSGTHAVLSLSGGDSNLIDSDLGQSAMGTGFAMSTNVLQNNTLQFGGTMAQNTGVTPGAMGLFAIYKRSTNSPFAPSAPEFTFTLSQIGLMNGSALTSSSGETGIPAVRTMSLSLYQSMELGDALRVEYGATGEAVDYLEYTTRVSPFARVTAPVGHVGELVAAFSDGARPDELRAHQDESESAGSETVSPDELSTAASTLSHLPQLSYSDGKLQMQRTLNYELGFRKTLQSQTYAISAFKEDVYNGRLDVSGDTSGLNPGNLMSDGTSAMSIYNIGNFKRTGVIVSADQRMGSFADLLLAYGRMGGMTASTGFVGSGQAGLVNESSHNVANANVNLHFPRSSAKLTAGYGWMDSRALIPGHVFTTQDTSISPGLNICIRQPLPSPFGMPGHFELSADLHNLLAQGYVPLDAGNGRTLLLLQSPRTVRGGLNFIF